MLAVETILSLYVAIAFFAYVARKLKIPYPLLLVVGGLGLSRIPNLPRVSIAPEYVFLVFLPPLLYHAALMTSWRDFRANLRPIGLLAVGLTLFTTVAIAVVAHYCLPGFAWPGAFLLGAIISPPDAIAATAVAQRLHVPKRIITILEGESLVNDAIALVAYRFALAATVSGVFSLAHAAGDFVWVSLGGIAFGLIVGVIVAFIRARMKEPSVEGIVSLLTPFLAYVPAERMHLSGVLAAVACGLYVARRVSHDASAATRIRNYAVWDALVFLLNGLVFILIGFALPEVLSDIGDIPTGLLIIYATLVSFTAIVVRLVWVFTATYIPRKLSASLARRDPMPSIASISMIGWTGMRGIVSLAAALAVPRELTVGSAHVPFPSRPLILFLTFGTILVTLLLQGLSMPLVIRLLGLKDTGEDEHDEEVAARYLIALAAIERLDGLVTNHRAAEQVVRRVRREYDEHLGHYSSHLAAPGRALGPVCDTDAKVRREALDAGRKMLVKLRDDGVIGDDIHRRIERELDLEESTLESG